MNSANVILYSGLIIAAFLVFSLAKKEKSEAMRLFLFLGMVIPIVFTTLYLAVETIAKNQQSATGGPVHWHADYEISSCRTASAVKGSLAHADEDHENINLKDPAGVSNRIGTPDLHEHGDNRIHVEGTVRRLEDVNLANFFKSIGGQLSPTFLRIPLNQGEFIAQNGALCKNGEPGTLQVFLYKTEGQLVKQEKLTNFTDYVLSPEASVPPGDCIIFEFTSEIKDKTDKICKFYEIAIQKGELRRGN